VVLCVRASFVRWKICHTVKLERLDFSAFGREWPYLGQGIKKNVTGAKKPLDLTPPNR
jgi:hypothetical protein